MLLCNVPAPAEPDVILELHELRGLVTLDFSFLPYSCFARDSEHVGVYMSTRNKRETEREREFGMREKGRGKRKDESKE